MIIRTFKELLVYQKAYDLAMEIFEISKEFPKAETYALTDQIRRSSRSVTANISEAYKKRGYPRMFIAKIVDCESEAAETQVWLTYCKDCGYIDILRHQKLDNEYDQVLSMLASMRMNHHKWTKPTPS